MDPSFGRRAPAGGRVSPSMLAGAIGDWSAGPGARYQRLADAIDAAVARGDLPQGSVLPAERVLAVRLAVARGTVVAAYQALRERGIVQRRQGSGTRVVGGTAAPAVVRDLAAGVRARRLTGRLVDQPRGDVIDLSTSVVPDARHLPEAAFALDRDHLVALADGHGLLPLGLPDLRERLAAWHADRGLPTTPEQIAVTIGGQQAIALTARLLVRPGDLVAVEVPAFPGAIDSFSRAGARFAPVAVDSGGLRVDALSRLLGGRDRGDQPRLVYTVPTNHNPTGTVMPDHRRRQLAQLADETGTWVLEDESIAPLTFDGSTPTSVAHHSRAGTVLTVGSLSKVAWAGLRVGWLRGPEAVVERIGRLRAAHDLGSGAASQVIALRLLDGIDELLHARRRWLAAEAAHLRARLHEALPSWQHDEPRGGLSLWVQLPDGASADRFAVVASEHGVAVLPGTVAAADESCPSHLRLTFARDRAVLDDAVDRLAAAWATTMGGDTGPAPSGRVRRSLAEGAAATGDVATTPRAATG